ncbi:MAG TPA: type II secretion system F family protein [Planctomycetaceae bacterium]|nr:type II secretion system F family protein [Planctomycetaceae bacterium]
MDLSQLQQFLPEGVNPAFLLISVAAFVGVATLVGAIAFIMRDYGTTKAEDRLQVLAGLKTPELEARGLIKEAIVREGVEGLTGRIHKALSRLGNLQALFDQSDSPIKPDVFFMISAVLGAVAVMAGWLARSPLALFPVLFVMGAVLPLVWLIFRRNSRFKKFAKQLPDALELVGRALRSGHSLASGLHVVVQEMPDPISTEFSMVYEEQNLGIPIEQALKNMLKRMPNLDLKFFVTAVAIQRQAGGDLAEILDKIGYIIRERFKILGQVQALTGEGRISGVVLMALPIALFFVVLHMNPGYVMLLFTDPLGRKMIIGAAVLQVLGAVTIKKIINIKV